VIPAGLSLAPVYDDLIPLEKCPPVAVTVKLDQAALRRLPVLILVESGRKLAPGLLARTDEGGLVVWTGSTWLEKARNGWRHGA
jgi:hypothetical protein